MAKSSPPDFHWENHVQSPDGMPSRFLGVRFDENGKFLPECGNTVVRHVVPGSATEAALVGLRAALMALPHGDHFAYTDVASYHMTVFEGIVGTRRKEHFWPDGLALDAPIDEATQFLDARLEGFSGPGAFDMRLAAVTPFGLTLTGASEKDEAIARAWRDALVAPFGYRSPQHDRYRFHTTLAYTKDWLPDAALPVYREALAELTADFAAAVPVIELGPSAFCTFEDMNAFPPARMLASWGQKKAMEKTAI